MQTLCALSEPVPDHVSETLWKILAAMNEDEVAVAVKSDKCILQLGGHLCNRMGHQSDKHEYIRQQLRQLGRALVHGRRVTTTLERMVDYIQPQNFPDVITTIRGICGYNEETATYKNSSLPIKIGHSLTKIAAILEAQALIAGDQDMVKNARDFVKIHDAKWNELITSHAYTTLSDKKMNKPLLLPFTEDVQKLHLYLGKRQSEYMHELSPFFKDLDKACKSNDGPVDLVQQEKGRKSGKDATKCLY